MRVQKLLIHANDIVFDSQFWDRKLYQFVRQHSLSENLTWLQFQNLWAMSLKDHPGTKKQSSLTECKIAQCESLLFKLGMQPHVVTELLLAIKPQLAACDELVFFKDVIPIINRIALRFYVTLLFETPLKNAIVLQQINRVGLNAASISIWSSHDGRFLSRESSNVEPELQTASINKIETVLDCLTHLNHRKSTLFCSSRTRLISLAKSLDIQTAEIVGARTTKTQSTNDLRLQSLQQLEAFIVPQPASSRTQKAG